MNLNGRTSLIYCFYWGLIAVAFLKLVYPWLKKIEKYIYKKGVRIFSVFFIIFMTFDIVISCMAGSRQNERCNGIPPQDKVDEFLDYAYPDEYLNKVYNNKKEV